VSTIAPGQLLSIFGPNLGLATAATTAATGQSLPATLGSSAAEFNGTPTRLLYASPRQVNLIAPYAISASDRVTLHYHAPLAGSLSQIIDFSLGVTPRAPATFQTFDPVTDYCGGGLVSFSGPTTLVHNEDGSINRCATPARPGSTVTIYINGGGVPNTSVDESQLAHQKTPVNVPVTVVDGEQPLDVVNVSLDPGSPIGVWRVDFRLGNNTGPRELTVAVDGVPIAQKRMFLFIKP
jgi:uncharacterized protein (TIGR03437 family)